LIVDLQSKDSHQLLIGFSCESGRESQTVPLSAGRLAPAWQTRFGRHLTEQEHWINCCRVFPMHDLFPWKALSHRTPRRNGKQVCQNDPQDKGQPSRGGAARRDSEKQSGLLPPSEPGTQLSPMCRWGEGRQPSAEYSPRRKGISQKHVALISWHRNTGYCTWDKMAGAKFGCGRPASAAGGRTRICNRWF